MQWIMRVVLGLWVGLMLLTSGVGWADTTITTLTGVSAVRLTPRPPDTHQWLTVLEISFATSRPLQVGDPAFAVHFFFDGRVGRPANADRTITAHLNDWGNLELHITPRPPTAPPVQHPDGELPPNWWNADYLHLVWIGADALGDTDGTMAILVTLPASAAELGAVVLPDTCLGHQVTHLGTAGPDTLIGSDEVDVILGLQGDDVLYGFGGNDIICGGSGHDRLYGGPGDDTLLGEAGHDVLMGGQGADTLTGGPGHDILQGDAGTDTLSGGPDIDVCDGGSDLDTADTSCERRQKVP